MKKSILFLIFGVLVFGQTAQSFALNSSLIHSIDSPSSVTNNIYIGDEGEAPTDGVKLILIGVVYEKGTTSPISGIAVQLENITDKTKRSFRTASDGTFYFTLKKDQSYELRVSNTTEDSKKIVTYNKSKPEILRAMLQVSSNPNAASQIAIQKPMELVKSPTTGKAVEDVPVVNTNLIFKIQLGAFKEGLPNKSPFLLKVKEKIAVENTTNGYVRYMAGEFTSLKDANQYMQDMKVRGYDKVFIVPYYKGERKKEAPEKAAEMYK